MPPTCPRHPAAPPRHTGEVWRCSECGDTISSPHGARIMRDEYPALAAELHRRALLGEVQDTRPQGPIGAAEARLLAGDLPAGPPVQPGLFAALVTGPARDGPSGGTHTCDPEICGLLYDPECPMWCLASAPHDAAEAVAIGLEWERRDRVLRIRLRLLRRWPDLPAALADMLADHIASEVAGELREALVEIVRQVLVDDLPGALDALGVRRRKPRGGG